jgi:hypothetical protein
MQDSKLTDELKKLREYRLDRDEAKEIYEQADKDFKVQERKVMEMMEHENAQSAKVDGVLFSRNSTIYGHVTDRAKFIEWAKEYDEELFEPRERAALINELVRTCINNGEEPPPGVGFYVRDYISQRAS